MVATNNLPAPGTDRFRVWPQGARAFVVLDPDCRVVSEPTPFRLLAEQECVRHQRAYDAARKRGSRPCMSCQKQFQSDGIHNRMCDHSRRVGAAEAIPVGFSFSAVNGRRKSG